MKRVNPTLAMLALAIAMVPGLSLAQGARIRMPDFSDLASRAKEAVDISLDKDMLRNAGAFMAGNADPQLVEQIKGLDGIYIKVFEFEHKGEFDMDDIDGMVRQVEGGRWKKMMSVRSKDERVEMWMHDNSADGGMFFIASEPKELVVINIVGKVDLETLRKLQGKMGVPGLPGLPGMGWGAPPAAPPAPPAAPAAPR
jgi:hypothetical protein